MRRDEAIATAKAIAEAEGWPWVEPVRAELVWGYILFGPACWVVMTDSDFFPGNVTVIIRDKEGSVIEKSFEPHDASYGPRQRVFCMNLPTWLRPRPSSESR